MKKDRKRDPVKLLKISWIVELILIAVLVAIPSGLATSPATTRDSGYDRILVKFKAGTDEITKSDVHRRHGDAPESEMSRIGVRTIKVPAGMSRDKVKAYLSEMSVEFAEPDYVARAVGTPSDPNLGVEWALAKIQAQQAWDITTGQPGIKIAILDSGIDQNHEDLAVKIVANQNFTTSATVDDLYGHGTHVAGVAAAATNNGIGVAGVGYNSSLMNVKVLDDSGNGNYSAVANGIIWAADNGARVISMSLGGNSASSTLESAVNYAWSKGVVLVAAAGNAGNTAAFYPAYYANVISVAATDQNDARASSSTYGSWVSLAAPGVSIYSTLPNHANTMGVQNYGYLSGSSMATPYVAGLAGLVWASSYGTSNTNVRNRIQTTTDAIAGTGTNWKYGRINAYKTVAAPVVVADKTPPAQTTGLTVTTVSSSQLKLSWKATSATDLKNYNVYRSTVSGGPYTLVKSPTTNTFTDSGLSASTTYYYVVSAIDKSLNEGLKSTQVSGKTGLENKLHIKSITMTLSKSGTSTTASASVTLVNAAGKAVSGAKVAGHWSIATTDTDTGTTNTSGLVKLSSNSVSAATGKTFTFTVDSITLSGWTYDTAANVLTGNSIKAP